MHSDTYLNAMKEARTTVSGKSDLMMSGLIQELIFWKFFTYFLVSQSESEQYKSEEGLISWQKSMRVISN